MSNITDVITPSINGSNLLNDSSQIVGCILGTAVGDAIGLPYEGVSRQRAPRLLGPPDRHRLFFRTGMVSDDTEHTCLVAQALIASGFEPEPFKQDFARRLRFWFAALPAGIGRATLRACLKLWWGVSPDSSGVYSAGNGPAMRAAIFGAVFDDIDQMVTFVRVSTRTTHTDPKAEYGAIAIALATSIGRRQFPIDRDAFVNTLAVIIGPDGNELQDLIRGVAASVNAGESTFDYAMNSGMNRGVSGYTYHTVPVTIHAWMTHPHDYRAAVSAVITCGGDADTTAAIVGGIVGAATGESGIPNDWIAGICDWPRTANWMRRLATQLARCNETQTSEKPIALNTLATIARNLIFLAIVIFHGFRRLLPPY